MRIQRILGLTKGPVFPQSAAVILLGFLLAGIPITAMARMQPSTMPSQSAMGASADELHLQSSYRAWLDQDVHWIIKPEERATFLKLSSDPERDQFIRQFWLRRDPAGAIPDTYRAEHYRRLAYANTHFAADIPGWGTDRGRIYIVYGPPSSIDAHPSGGGAANANPFEVWNYDHVSGEGRPSEIRFVDMCKCGNYVIDKGAR